jgi:hypothetical protein
LKKKKKNKNEAQLEREHLIIYKPKAKQQIPCEESQTSTWSMTYRLTEFQRQEF